MQSIIYIIIGTIVGYFVLRVVDPESHRYKGIAYLGAFFIYLIFVTLLTVLYLFNADIINLSDF